MKLDKLKEFYLKKGLVATRQIKKEYQNKKRKESFKTKIIGITGSKGKSTTAFLLHEYLKLLGYKSILYSSIKIDSPASRISNKNACEVAVYKEEDLLNIIEEVEAYDPDFLILEVNESTIQKGLLDNFEFDIKLLTNLNPKHNLENYTEEEYVSLKKRFFENTSKKTKCIYGLQDYSKDLLETLLSCNECEKYVFSTRHILEVKNVNETTANCLLVDLVHSLKGLDMTFLLNGREYSLHTNLIMNYNALNVLGVITTLNVLGLFNLNKFQELIKNIRIPGRAELYKYKGRYIVIDSQLPTILCELYEYKQKGILNKIKVVIGSIGYGHYSWEQKFSSSKHIDQTHQSREYVANLLKKYADYVYITESDSGAEDLLTICKELQDYLNDEIQSEIVNDRQKAIEKAIIEAKPGDIILISGRGNRMLLCDGKFSTRLIVDSEAVLETFRKDVNSKYGC